MFKNIFLAAFAAIALCGIAFSASAQDGHLKTGRAAITANTPGAFLCNAVNGEKVSGPGPGIRLAYCRDHAIAAPSNRPGPVVRPIAGTPAHIGRPVFAAPPAVRSLTPSELADLAGHVDRQRDFDQSAPSPVVRVSAPTAPVSIGGCWTPTSASGLDKGMLASLVFGDEANFGKFFCPGVTKMTLAKSFYGIVHKPMPDDLTIFASAVAQSITVPCSTLKAKDYRKLSPTGTRSAIGKWGEDAECLRFEGVEVFNLTEGFAIVSQNNTYQP